MPPIGKSRIGGIVLILVGVFLLAVQLIGFRWGSTWPLLMILGGLAFVVMFLRDRKKLFGVLMPASVLLIIGCMLAAGEWYGWDIMQDIWPLFIAAPGIGFLAMYFFGPHEPGLLFPAAILCGLAAVFLLINYDRGEYWPAILIAIGLLIIFARSAPPEIPPGQ